MVGIAGYVMLISCGIISMLNIIKLFPYTQRSIKYIIPQLLHKYGNTVLLWWICNALLLLCFLTLLYAFIFNVNEIAIVYEHSSQNSALLYKVAGVWSNHEGSMLLWLLSIGLSGILYTILSRSSDAFKEKVLQVLSAVFGLFILYVLFFSNPFVSNVNSNGDGLGLTPLLQDPALLYHPPSLYLGYVGFVLSYAICVAAALGGQPMFEARVWVLFSWGFLTFGIVMGSLWAYRELGWGGYWFWDPVENSALLPWLSATALIHCLIINDKQGNMRNWCLCLGILTFVMSIIGTFIVRSGLLVSVHTFATDPSKGIIILLITALIMFGGFASVIYDALRNSGRLGLVVVGGGSGSDDVPRGTLMRLNILLICISLVVVFIGTIYPVISELLFAKELSVGGAYFSKMLKPIAFLIIIGAFLATNVSWEDSWRKLFHKIKIEILIGVLFLYGFLLYPYDVVISAAIISIYFVNIIKKIIQHHSINLLISDVIHASLSMLLFAIIANHSFKYEATFTVHEGDSFTMHEYHVQLTKILYGKEKNHLVQQAVLKITNSAGKKFFYAYPENRLFINQEYVSIKSYRVKLYLHDLYFNIRANSENTFIIYAAYQAYINLIWIAAFTIVLCVIAKLLLFFLCKKKQ